MKLPGNETIWRDNWSPVNTEIIFVCGEKRCNVNKLTVGRRPSAHLRAGLVMRLRQLEATIREWLAGAPRPTAAWWVERPCRIKPTQVQLQQHSSPSSKIASKPPLSERDRSMLLRAGEQQTDAKWQSFSIRSVLGDTLNDDDEEEDLDVVFDADRPPTPPGEASSPADSSRDSVSGSEDATGRERHQNDNDVDVHKTTDFSWSSTSSLRRNDEVYNFSRWTALHAAPNVIITSPQHQTELNSPYFNHGSYIMHTEWLIIYIQFL